MGDYSLDGEKVTLEGLMTAAESEGYGDDGDWLLTTSGAARVLRDNGHEVSAWSEEPVVPQN